jgi:hypothetical protein
MKAVNKVMLTYKQFLSENMQYVASDDMEIDNVRVKKGSTYYLDSKGHLDRKDGPALINHLFSEWFKHGKSHRIGKPALIYVDGEKWWNVNGEHHRLDGPARESINHDFDMWYIRGRYITRGTITEEDRWLFLKSNIQNNLEILNVWPGMNKEMQEYVIKLRPDLINKIEYLNPDLARKYQHAVELGNVDL